MREIHPDLLDCLRRANPYVEIVTELSAPDVSDVLRRVDQFTGAKRVSVVPANSMATSPRGPLSIASGTVALANFPGEQGSFDLNRENPIRRLKGARFKMESAFIRAVLRTVTVRVSRTLLTAPDRDWELQIYRVTRTPGVRQGGDPGTSSYRATAWTEYAFRPLLSPAVVIKGSSVVWDGALKATLAFDLINHGFVLENTVDEAVAADQVGELPSYYFVVKPVNPPKAAGSYKWLTDTATARVIAGVGTFERVFWARDGEDQQWAEDLKGDAPNIKLDIEQYQASTQVVYSLDFGRVPTAGTSGRAVFERLLPPGTAASLELSTAGAVGPWTVVKHGDAVATAQQTYHLRLTLNADAALRSSPGATALGVEFRRVYDVGVESVVDLPEREISLPWLKASIPSGGLDVVRTGIRDYLDVATTIGSKESPTKLEAEIFLTSRHPSVTRDKWLRLERLLVTDREPLGTHEKFALTSYAARLKRKVPEKKETISSTHTVQAGSTAAAVLVAPPLVGATSGGNEYDSKGYYIRVQQTAVAAISPGHLQTIQGNTGTGQLDFVPAMNAALAAGDIIEVHSGIYQTQVVTWQDADPADVWWELWTAKVGLAPERIGLGSLPRGGRPPTLADRAPGDVATQNKLRITGRLSEEESAYEIADQLDFIMGGATVEIDGQICFIQIYALRDAAGVVTVPLPPVSAVLDPRDYATPKFPPGIERRATVLAAKYGKNSAASNPDAYPERLTTVVDNDAFAWLAKPEIEDLGIVELPDSISRWLYNTTDSGLYLATSLARMLVNATATGLRVFTLPLIEAHPELMPGDTVTIVTDSYTDYDPATQTELRGWLAIRGVIVGSDSMGRELKVFIAGLADNVVSLAGGQVGDISSLGDAPEKPSVAVSFDGTGKATINIDGRDRTASLKVAVAKLASPPDGDVEATAAIEGAGASVPVAAPTWAPGEALYGKAFAYAGAGGTGRRSEATVFTVYRESGLLPDDRKGLDKERARSAGLGRALVEASLRRSGLGGVFMRAAAFVGFDIYDRAGTFALINAELGRATADLDGPTGIGMDVVERGGNKGDQALDASNIAVAAAVDLSRGYTNKHLGNIPDDSTTDRKAVTTNEKTGASRAYPALDTTNKLVTGVTSAATAADGLTGIASKRAAVRAAGVGTTIAAHERRRGSGGTVSSPFTKEPIYSADGARPLINTITREILPDLAIGAGVRGAADVAFGGSVKFQTNRHNESGSGLHTASVTFGTSYEQVPEVRVLPQTWRIPTAGNTVEFKSINATVSGATIRAVEITSPISTARTDDFASTLNGTPQAAGITIGAPSSEAFCNLANANTVATTYKVYFDVNTTSKSGGGFTRVTAYRNDGVASTTWTQVGQNSYDDGVNLTGEKIEFSAALAANWDIRLMVTYSSGTPSANATVVADRVDYDAVTNSGEVSLTNVGGGAVLLQAVEKS